MFIFGSQNVKNHNFFKQFEQSKSSQILFPVKKIFRFYKLPTNGPMNSWQKLWLSSFLLNFKNSISRFDFQNVYVKPNCPNFLSFWAQKNANNKYFRKNFCIYNKRILSQKLVHIQKTNTKTKNFCDTPLLIYATGCGIIFRISTIIFRNANRTYTLMNIT